MKGRARKSACANLTNQEVSGQISLSDWLKIARRPALGNFAFAVNQYNRGFHLVGLSLINKRQKLVVHIYIHTLHWISSVYFGRRLGKISTV